MGRRGRDNCQFQTFFDKLVQCIQEIMVGLFLLTSFLPAIPFTPLHPTNPSYLADSASLLIFPKGVSRILAHYYPLWNKGMPKAIVCYR